MPERQQQLAHLEFLGDAVLGVKFAAAGVLQPVGAVGSAAFWLLEAAVKRRRQELRDGVAAVAEGVAGTGGDDPACRAGEPSLERDRPVDEQVLE